MNDPTAISDPPRSSRLSFAWDRDETPESLRKKLAEAAPKQWVHLAAWILREARVPEVWDFLTPKQIEENWNTLEPLLGRRRDLWKYLIETWHELGKL